MGQSLIPKAQAFSKIKLSETSRKAIAWWSNEEEFCRGSTKLPRNLSVEAKFQEYLRSKFIWLYQDDGFKSHAFSESRI